MLTGSFASSYHGTPRATQDIDIVIAPTADQILALAALLPDTEYYVDVAAALDAQKHQGNFNIIESTTGWKINLFVRKTRPFSRGEFDRGGAVEFQGMKLSIASAEDVVIAKLEWAKIGGSQRQVEDVAGILRIRTDQLDLDYVRSWVRELDLQVQWEAACRSAGIAI